MKNIKRKVTIGMAVMAASAILTTPVFAYTPIAGTAAGFQFEKDFVMSKNATIPAATFSYSIVPGAAIAATATTAEVIPGPAGASIADVVYTTGDTTATVTESGGTKTATKNVPVNLSGVSFPAPGIYRYVITESGTNNGVTNDPVAKRTLAVYVQNATGGVLDIGGYVLYEGEKTEAPSKTASVATGKSEGYTNEYDTFDLSFGKEVKGNFGALDQYFEYTVTIAADQGTVLNVDISGADATPAATASTKKTVAANPTTLTAGANGITQKFYLHDGQYITIKDLPANAAYSVTEDAEDYVQAAGIAAADNAGGIAYTGSASGTITADVKTGFTNTRETITPTGIAGEISNMLPGILAIGAGVIGAGSFIAVKRKKQKKSV